MEYKELNKKHTIIYNNENYKLEMGLVKIEDIFFNPLNTRVKDIIDTTFPDYIGDDLFNEEIQNIIFENLKKQHNTKINVKLKEKLKIIQTEPFILTKEGIIVSGNNRFSIIKSDPSLYEKYKEIIVAFIPGVVGQDELTKWELSAQKENDLKQDYEEMNFILRISELSNKNTDINTIKNIASIDDEAQIQKMIRIGNIYKELLLYANIPGKIDLHRTFSTYSALDSLDNLLYKTNTKQQEKKLLKTIYFNIILGTEIPVIKTRDLVGKVAGNGNISLNDRLKILSYIDNEIESFTKESVEAGMLAKFSSSDTRLKFGGETEDFYDNLQDSIKQSIIFKKKEQEDSFMKVINLLSKNKDTLNNINDIMESTIAFSYSDDEKEQLHIELKKHLNLIKEILGE